MVLKVLSSLVFLFCYMEVTLQYIFLTEPRAPCGRMTEAFDVRLWYFGRSFRESIFHGCITGYGIIGIELLSRVSTIEENTFVNMYRLNDITISNNRIRILKPGFVKNTPNLREFDAEKNKLSFIPKGAFNHLDLDNLWLNSNEISFIEAGAFANLEADALVLSKNKLTEVNSSWFSDSWIRRLALDHNQITTLYADAFKEVNELRILELKGNKIHFIGENTFSGVAFLRKLDLSWNLLGDINFLNDITVQFIDLSFNAISGIDMNESMKTEQIVIYPNPWNCKCLMQFWKYAWKHGLKYTHALSQLVSSNDEFKKLPVCVVHGGCDSRDPEILRKYFNFVSYTRFKNAQ